LLIVAGAIVMVAIGYVVVLLLGGTALRNLPFGEQIGRFGEEIGGPEILEPDDVPLPPLDPSEEELIPTPGDSPLVARPSPSPSPSFIPPSPGQPTDVTFVIEYENTTGVRLTGVRITDRIPGGTVFRQGSATPPASFDGQQLLWEIGTLDPGEIGKVSFTVFTNRTGRVTNRAVITSNEAPSREVESSARVD
ncbi:MAG: hypothetical protein ACRDI1_10720, partial [Actinomycetota bacterium]